MTGSRKPEAERQLSRALGTLYGLAIGDALGMPTQMLSPAEVATSFGAGIERFEPAAWNHPIAALLPAGSTTDDTAQMLLLARALVKDAGLVDARRWAYSLLEWETTTKQRGSHDLLGPSTSAALAAVRAGGSLAEAGVGGATNGAAMRIAPVGVATSLGAGGATMDLLVERVWAASMLTHNTGVALAGAMAIAAAVSCGVGGGNLDDAIICARAGAATGAGRGRWVAGGDVAARISWAVGLVADTSPRRARTLIQTLVGTSLATQESVPAAFAILATHRDDPWSACCSAASLGGDSDTIAAMVGAVAGACYGVESLPPEAIKVVSDVNALDLEALAVALIDLRTSS